MTPREKLGLIVKKLEADAAICEASAAGLRSEADFIRSALVESGPGTIELLCTVVLHGCPDLLAFVASAEQGSN